MKKNNLFSILFVPTLNLEWGHFGCIIQKIDMAYTSFICIYFLTIQGNNFIWNKKDAFSWIYMPADAFFDNILFNNKMSCRILQNNNLYRRIQHKNLFKTFTKTYNRRSLSRQQEDRSKLNNTLEQSTKINNLTMDNLSQTKVQLSRNEKTTIKSQRYELQTSIPMHMHQKYSTKLLTCPLQTHSKTTPIQFQLQNIHKERRFSRQCQTTLSTKNHTSEVILLKWNQRRKKEEFKLKSCFEKDRINYQCPVDEAEFSTIELKKRSQILNKRDDRYNQKWKVGVLRENNKDTMSQADISIGSTKRGAFILSKYSKFIQEGLKNHMEALNKTKK